MQKIQHNSPVNQGIKRKLVSNEVIMNASQLVDDLSNKLMFGNCSIYEVAENLIKEFEEDHKGTCDICQEKKELNEDDLCEDCFEDSDYRYNEPLEWWFVSGYFYRELKKRGEVVYNSDYGYLWGRTCSGQAILLDSVISSIAEDMEILEGQANDWSEHAK